jgi:hypothetical protein
MASPSTAAQEDTDTIAEMHMIAVLEQLAALKAGEIDGSFTDGAKAMLQRIKDAAAAAKAAGKAKYAKWKEAHDKSAHDKLLPHDKSAPDAPGHASVIPTAVVHAAHPSPMVIEFPEKYAERMDKYIGILTALLDMMMQIMAKKQETDEPQDDGPRPEDAQPLSSSSAEARRYYVVSSQ